MSRTRARSDAEDALQELDHVPLVASITRRAATASSPETVAAEVEAAAAAALTAHRGPAFLDFPLDVLFAATDPAVPEPTAAAILLVASTCLLRRTRARD